MLTVADDVTPGVAILGPYVVSYEVGSHSLNSIGFVLDTVSTNAAATAAMVATINAMNVKLTAIQTALGNIQGDDPVQV